MYMANKRIRLRLTGIGETLTETAEKRLEASEDNILLPVCDNGRTMEDYETLGFPQDKIPKELIQRQKDYELGIELKDEDYDKVYSDVSLYEDQILFKVTDEYNTTLFIKGGFTISVLETCEEIDYIVDYLSLNWFERNWLLFLNLFRRKSKNIEDDI